MFTAEKVLATPPFMLSKLITFILFLTFRTCIQCIYFFTLRKPEHFCPGLIIIIIYNSNILFYIYIQLIVKTSPVILDISSGKLLFFQNTSCGKNNFFHCVICLPTSIRIKWKIRLCSYSHNLHTLNIF